MKNIKFLFLGLLFLGLFNTGLAQKLLPASNSFSGKKIAFIQAVDGSSFEVQITNIDRTNGLIKSLTFQQANGEEQTMWVNEIKSVYLPSLDRDISSKSFSFLRNDNKWDNNELRSDLINDGYSYFEQTKVELGEKTRVMLLQLLNPSFSSKIKVFMDPWASEVTITEFQKNYENVVDKIAFYVKDGGFPAFKLNKSMYKDNFTALFGECENMSSMKQKADWTSFGKHVYQYSRCK